MILEYSSWQVNGLKRIWDESSPLMQTGADLSSAQLSAKDLWCCDSFQWRLFPFMSFFYICELLLPGTLNTLNLPNHRNVCSICCNSTPHHPHLNDLFSEVKHARLVLLLKIGRLTASFSAEIQVYITPSDGNGIKLEKKTPNFWWKPIPHGNHLEKHRCNTTPTCRDLPLANWLPGRWRCNGALLRAAVTAADWRKKPGQNQAPGRPSHPTWKQLGWQKHGKHEKLQVFLIFLLEKCTFGKIWKIIIKKNYGNFWRL